MTKYKEGRYTYYIIPESNIVKCVSTYAKKPYVGISKCRPEDTFNESIGKYIARVRCDNKINQKRMESLNRDLAIASKMIDYWIDEQGMLQSLICKAEKERNGIIAELKNISEELV